jgi:hypothetical protein
VNKDFLNENVLLEFKKMCKAAIGLLVAFIWTCVSIGAVFGQDADQREIKCQLVLPEGLTADLEAAEIWVSSVDGVVKESAYKKANADGSFLVATKSSELGFDIFTRDGKASYFDWKRIDGNELELVLNPTVSYSGRLLEKQDDPIGVSDRTIKVLLPTMSKDPRNARSWVIHFSHGFQTTTDADGSYTIENLPTFVPLMITTPFPGDPHKSNNLAMIYLKPGERPTILSSFGNNRPKPPVYSLKQAFDRTLRDCRINNYRLIVVSRPDNDECRDFVNDRLLARAFNTNLTKYMHVEVQGGRVTKTEEDIEFARSKNWPVPNADQVFVCILDVDGSELNRTMINLLDENSSEKAKTLVDEFALPPKNAQRKFDEAITLAKESDRKVWVRLSGRYCGPCLAMSRWLDDHNELLQKDYVMLKIDNSDANVEAVFKGLIKGRATGIPFYAILDAEGNAIADSISPAGSIGMPNSVDGKAYLREIIEKTRKRITDDEINQLIDSIK